jgi:glutamate/tyrosine decarboxylase-like PLP-dependent enzyme
MIDPTLDLDAETMRHLGYQVVDHLVTYLSGLDAEPAWRGATRAELEARLREPPPDAAEPFEELFTRLQRDVLSHTARVDHARFLAFVPGSPTWPGVLADFLVSGHNVFQGTWLGAAGPSEIELVVLEWFRNWLEMPAGAGGLFTSGGSAATLTAIAAARRLRSGGHDPLAVVYRSAECHSSVERALLFLGFSEAQMRIIPTDCAQRLLTDRLEQAVIDDVAAGQKPFMVIANAGATSTGAIDPLTALVQFCRSYGIWLHVDAAYGGFAVLTERGRRWLEGLGEADSVTLDPHKWLYQPFEAGCLMVRDARSLQAAFRLVPDYLRDAAVSDNGPDGPPGEVNFTDRGFQLTRAAKALKVWLSIRYFGLDAFRAAINHTLDLANYAEARIRASPSLELVTPATLGIVCFRRRLEDASAQDAAARSEALNTSLVRALADSGVGMVSSTRVNGQYALRVCILNYRTRQEDVERVLSWLETAQV